MRQWAALALGVLALALPARAQQPQTEQASRPEEQQPPLVRRYPPFYQSGYSPGYSIYGPYYILDEDGEPTGAIRPGPGMMGADYGAYGPGYGSGAQSYFSPYWMSGPGASWQFAGGDAGWGTGWGNWTGWNGAWSGWGWNSGRGYYGRRGGQRGPRPAPRQ